MGFCVPPRTASLTIPPHHPRIHAVPKSTHRLLNQLKNESIPGRSGEKIAVVFHLSGKLLPDNSNIVLSRCLILLLDHVTWSCLLIGKQLRRPPRYLGIMRLALRPGELCVGVSISFVVDVALYFLSLWIQSEDLRSHAGSRSASKQSSRPDGLFLYTQYTA